MVNHNIEFQANAKKWILEHLKTKSGLPIILYGNTGCGKTFILDELKNDILQHGYKISDFYEYSCCKNNMIYTITGKYPKKIPDDSLFIDFNVITK